MTITFEATVEAICEGIRVDKIDDAFVRKFRADFELLVSNLSRLKTNSDLRIVADGLKRWDSYMSSMFLRRGDYENDEFPFPGSIYDFLLSVAKAAVKAGATPEHRARDWFDSSVRQIDDCAEGLHKALQIPKKWLKTKRKITATAEELSQVVENIKDWGVRLFVLLDNLALTVASFGRHTGMKTPVLKTAIREPAEIAGFNTIVRGYDPDDKSHREMLEFLRSGLVEFRQRASRSYPFLLKILKQVVLNFDCPPTVLGMFFRESGTVNLCVSSIFEASDRRVLQFVQTLAHETAHYLYFKVMSKESQKLWTAAVESDVEPLDLEKIANAWPTNAKTLDDALKTLKRTDPKTAVTLMTLVGFGIQPTGKLAKLGRFTLPYGDRDMFVPVALSLAKEPAVRKLRVQRHPVSAYGTTSPQEAFAEVCGNLVAYGPRTLDPMVLSLFRVVTASK